MQVQDILHNKHFQKAEVIAGRLGLHNVIKWVHIIEIVNVENFVKGNELVLTTGLGIQNDVDKFLYFVKGLIESNCAALCIEYGQYIQQVPYEVVQLADEHAFPIIVFKEEVAFIEITQELHSLIINRQYAMVSKLENYSEKLNKETLYAQQPEEILKITYKYLEKPLVLKIDGQEPILYPNTSKKHKACLLQKLEEESYVQKLLVQPIHLFEHKYAEVMLVEEKASITEFETLILDRTATALGQLFIRKLYVEEKKGMEDAHWIEGWIEGKHSKDEIHHYLFSQWPSLSLQGGAVFITQFNESFSQQKLDITYYKLLGRSIFEQYGFLTLIIEKKKYIIFILLNKREGSMKDRMKEALSKLGNSEVLAKIHPSSFQFAVGKITNDLHCMHDSFQTALDTLYIKRKVGTPAQFYDDLHLFRLIYNLQKHVDLEQMVEDYLQPLIEFDEKNNGQLLETLEVYLQTNGSKQETARRLYIVRQTLYHRIRKIESLLGEDFMNGEKRLALEFMLLARKFLVPMKKGSA